MNVHSQMLVRAQVVNDAVPLHAPNHVRVESTNSLRFEGSNPSHSFSPNPISIGIIPDRKWHIPAVFRKHDTPPRSDIEEGQRIESTMPDLFHDSTADSSHLALAVEPEPPLYLRV